MKRTGVAALLLAALVASGCWDRREIEEQSLVLASGIDTCDGDSAECLNITRQIAIPGRIPLGQAGGGGPASTVWVLSTSGKDAMDSAARAQSELNRKISFGHLRILVLGEELSRRGLEHYVDYLRRLPEVRRLMWVVVSEGPAVNVMRARPRLERVPSLYLSDMMDEAARTGRIPKVFFGEFLSRISNRGEEAIVPLVSMAGPDEPALAGLAVFRGTRMVGRLSPEETVTFMQILGLRKGAETLAVDLPGGGRADVRVSERSSRYTLQWVGGRLHVDMKIRLECELLQLSGGLRSNDPVVLARIEALASDQVTTQAGRLVQKLQHELGADVLGIGERVRAHLPAAWRRIDQWSATFADARFRFETSVYLRRTLMAQ